ncbi:hypothetical protein C3941_12420 [Kaistia algarum]|uniref:hypothetical protein n=1 Tax=Kaistia algarum TaxID=2083279 RepID=UPI000CE80B17|nr:hypothetical protein [Kaistia algarum]MCX5515154.1 hypothetical protein [Kaistia algarum]PPE79875.1 hypothetical protein C3941_12420 [Kaistia algarum]
MPRLVSWRIPRGALAAAAATVVLSAGLIWRSVGLEPGCRSRLGEVQAALAASNGELSRASGASVPEQCAIYSRRADLLGHAASLDRLCGSGLLAKAELWRSVDAEQRAYEHLVAQTCPAAG